MQRFKGVGSYGTVGLDFAVAIAIGTLGGKWLDSKFGTLPWLTIVGLMFGIAAGFNLLIKAAKRLREEAEHEERKRAEEEEQQRRDDDGGG
jgi:ATP synthase protein I